MIFEFHYTVANLNVNFTIITRALTTSSQQLKTTKRRSAIQKEGNDGGMQESVPQCDRRVAAPLWHVLGNWHSGNKLKPTEEGERAQRKERERSRGTPDGIGELSQTLFLAKGSGLLLWKVPQGTDHVRNNTGVVTQARRCWKPTRVWLWEKHTIWKCAPAGHHYYS